MNFWDNRVLRITLSAAGADALAGYFGGTIAEVVVVETDSLGLWAVYGAERSDGMTLVFLRWEYIVSAEQEVVPFPPEPEPPAKSNVIGFRAG